MTWGQVKNLGSGGSRLDLIYSKLFKIISVDYAINYPGVNYFQPYADPKFGMQYSGQPSIHNSWDRTFMSAYNYFYQIWFWVCCDPIEEPFVIMTLNYD